MNKIISLLKTAKDIVVRNKFFSIIIVVLVIWGIFVTLQLSSLKKKIEFSIFYHELIYHSDQVDTSVETAQKINSPFIISKINVTQHLDGVKIKGAVINTSSVRYNNSEFKIKAGGQERTFYVDHMGSGAQGLFNVFIPAISPADVRWVTIEYVGGSVVWNKY